MGRQKKMTDSLLDSIGADRVKFARTKEYCSGCNDFVPAREYVVEQGLCTAHYNDMVQEQEMKWGEK
jgi:hypothetical protein